MHKLQFIVQNMLILYQYVLCASNLKFNSVLYLVSLLVVSYNSTYRDTTCLLEDPSSFLIV